MLAGCMLMSMPPLVWHACASMQPHACAFPYSYALSLGWERRAHPYRPALRLAGRLFCTLRVAGPAGRAGERGGGRRGASGG